MQMLRGCVTLPLVFGGEDGGAAREGEYTGVGARVLRYVVPGVEGWGGEGEAAGCAADGGGVGGLGYMV